MLNKEINDIQNTSKLHINSNIELKEYIKKLENEI